MAKGRRKINKAMHLVKDLIHTLHKDGHFLDIADDECRELFLNGMGAIYEADSCFCKAMRREYVLARETT